MRDISRRDFCRATTGTFTGLVMSQIGVLEALAAKGDPPVKQDLRDKAYAEFMARRSIDSGDYRAYRAVEQFNSLYRHELQHPVPKVSFPYMFEAKLSEQLTDKMHIPTETEKFLEIVSKAAFTFGGTRFKVGTFAYDVAKPSIFDKSEGAGEKRPSYETVRKAFLENARLRRGASKWEQGGFFTRYTDEATQMAFNAKFNDDFQEASLVKAADDRKTRSQLKASIDGIKGFTEEQKDTLKRIADDTTELKSSVEDFKKGNGELASLYKEQLEARTEHELMQVKQEAVNLISALVSFVDPKLGKKCAAVGSAYIAIEHNLGILQSGGSDFSPLLKSAACMNTATAIAGVVMSLLSGSSPEEIMLEQLDKLTKFVRAFQEEMHDRFNSLERSLDQKYRDIMNQLAEMKESGENLTRSVHALLRRVSDDLQRQHKQEMDALGTLFVQDARFAHNKAQVYYRFRKDQVLSEDEFVYCANVFIELATAKSATALLNGASGNGNAGSHASPLERYSSGLRYYEFDECVALLAEYLGDKSSSQLPNLKHFAFGTGAYLDLRQRHLRHFAVYHPVGAPEEMLLGTAHELTAFIDRMRADPKPFETLCDEYNAALKDVFAAVSAAKVDYYRGAFLKDRENLLAEGKKAVDALIAEYDKRKGTPVRIDLRATEPKGPPIFKSLQRRQLKNALALAGYQPPTLSCVYEYAPDMLAHEQHLRYLENFGKMSRASLEMYGDFLLGRDKTSYPVWQEVPGGSPESKDEDKKHALEASQCFTTFFVADPIKSLADLGLGRGVYLEKFFLTHFEAERFVSSDHIRAAALKLGTLRFTYDMQFQYPANMGPLRLDVKQGFITPISRFDLSSHFKPEQGKEEELLKIQSDSPPVPEVLAKDVVAMWPVLFPDDPSDGGRKQYPKGLHAFLSSLDDIDGFREKVEASNVKPLDEDTKKLLAAQQQKHLGKITEELNRLAETPSSDLSRALLRLDATSKLLNGLSYFAFNRSYREDSAFAELLNPLSGLANKETFLAILETPGALTGLDKWEQSAHSRVERLKASLVAKLADVAQRPGIDYHPVAELVREIKLHEKRMLEIDALLKGHPAEVASVAIPGTEYEQLAQVAGLPQLTAPQATDKSVKVTNSSTPRTTRFSYEPPGVINGWLKVVTNQSASGQSDEEYCKAHGLGLKTFQRWKQYFKVSKGNK